MSFGSLVDNQYKDMLTKRNKIQNRKRAYEALKKGGIILKLAAKGDMVWTVEGPAVHTRIQED